MSANQLIGRYMHKLSQRAPQNPTGAAVRKFTLQAILPPSFYLPFSCKRKLMESLSEMDILSPPLIEPVSNPYIGGTDVAITGVPGQRFITLQMEAPLRLLPRFGQELLLSLVLVTQSRLFKHLAVWFLGWQLRLLLGVQC